MGLVDLTTDLKSLRYGKDVRGGGNSRESAFLNDLYSPAIPNIISVSGQDGFIRGGSTVTERTEFDIKRFGNFISSPKGLMFIAKQEILARQQSKLPPSILQQI